MPKTRRDELIEHWAALRQRKDELERDLKLVDFEIAKTEGRIEERNLSDDESTED